MNCILLSSEDLILLLERKQLPFKKTLLLQKKQIYAFYHNDWLYGLYRLKFESKNYYYLEKNNYRPLKLYGNQKIRTFFINNPDFVFDTWKNRQSIKGNLFMLFREDENYYYFQIIDKYLPNLFENLKIKKTKHLLSIIDNISQITNSLASKNLSSLKNWGQKLYRLSGFKLIDHYLKNKLIKINSPQKIISFPLTTLYNGKSFFFLKNSIIIHHHNPKPKLRLNSFVLISSDEDSYMQKEKNVIEKIFMIKKHFQSHFLISKHKNTLITSLENTDFAHLIYHGSSNPNQQGFLINQQLFFSLDDLSKLARTPKVLFLSVCHSNQEKLIEGFFKLGTQTIIVSQSYLFSFYVPEVIKFFYQYLLLEKLNIINAFHLIIKKLYKLNDINAIKLRIYGLGQEKLLSNK
jgi:hypothetical protein